MAGKGNCQFTTVEWGDYNTTTFTSTTMSHTYADTINYMVSITENCASGYIFELGIPLGQISRLDLDIATLRNLICYDNLLSRLDLSKNTELQYLICNGNQLSSLDLNNNAALNHLECQNNQLNSLVLSPNVTLQRLYCNNNQLLLSDLDAASQRVQYSTQNLNKRMGPQFLPARQIVVGDTIDFSSQAKCGNTNTVFKVEKDYIGGVQAIVNVDYTIDSGKIVFNNAGHYFITMTNSAITTDQNYPAIVFAEFLVRGFNTDAALVNLSVSKGKLAPMFQSDTLNYSVNVEYEVSEISINAIANDTNATISGDTGLQQLAVGANIFTITVAAEDKTITQNYIITVNRADTIIENNIIEITQKVVKIYPNPTSGKIYLQEESNVKVYSVQGQLLREVFGKEVDLSSYPQGLYFLKVDGKVFKVVKQ
ncbi:MAG: cadherin-like beta sandwich domain-containing protein [Lentimicrobiaceae bacterium]|nr:cadherin-like beta sandwich domain-containing protein [Lentimicrobiaceae bacterium]